MIKKLMLAFAALAMTSGIAVAQVDVNKADAAALDGVKGVGPSMSKAILDERAKGEFKGWSDLQGRIKGLGDKKAARLSEAGLVVNGKGREGAVAKPAAKGDQAGHAAGVKAGARAGAKADAKADTGGDPKAAM